MFRKFLSRISSRRWPNFATRGMLKRVTLLLGIFVPALGSDAADAIPLTAEQLALEKRLDVVRNHLKLQASLAAQHQAGESSPLRLAQWVNWPNWGNWYKWPNWPNWPNWAKWFNY